MIVKDIPLPLVLGDNRRVHPTRVSINLAMIPLSDASMSLPQGESLPARGYVELFTCMGSAGVFRVRSPQDAYGVVTTTAELEHAIVEVGDYLVRTKYDEMMPANTAMQTVFSHYRGTKWQLGSVSALGSGQIALQANYDKVLEAMLAILEQKPECIMSFDFNTTPWTVNIVSRDTTVTAEGRLARNVNSAKVIYDDTELCTRAYFEKPVKTDSGDFSDFPTFDVSVNYSKNDYVVYSNKLYQLNNGHVKGVTWANTTKTLVDDIPDRVWDSIDADTIGTYGVVEREVQTSASNTADEAVWTVNEYLKKHKNPRTSVDISAVELSSITGESIDNFSIGKLFRLCLVDYNNLIIDKNVINLYFEDVYKRPQAITVTLADEEDTAVSFLHDLDAKGGAGGGGRGKKQQDDQWKEFLTDFEMDDYHIALYAQQFKNAEEILRQAGLYIDAQGVLIYADDLSEADTYLGAKLAVNANAITAEVTRATNAEDSLSGRIDVEADRIGLVVSGTGQYAQIKAAQIWASIDTTLRQSQVTISADIIDIDGLLTAFESEAITCGNITCEGSLSVDQDASIEGTVSAYVGSFPTLIVNEDDASWQTYNARRVSLSGEKYILVASESGSTSAMGTTTGYIVSGYSDTTLHYLGYPDAE